MAKRDAVQEYMAAHPERVHQGASPAAVARGKVAKVRGEIEAARTGNRYAVAGWCSVTREPVYSLAGESPGKLWEDHKHPGRPGCVVSSRVIEGDDGRFYAVEPEWDKEP